LQKEPQVLQLGFPKTGTNFIYSLFLVIASIFRVFDVITDWAFTIGEAAFWQSPGQESCLLAYFLAP
jgi:hypothetical protein